MFAFGNLAHLFLHVMSYWKQCLAQLPVVYLGKKIGLVFHRIGTCNEPLLPVYDFGLCIMPCCYQVIIVPGFLVESSKLYQTVAHHVRIRRKTVAHLVHSIFSNLLPILLMTVDHLQPAAISGSNGCGHLEVFLARTVPLLFFLGTYLYIKAIGMQSLTGQLINHH